MMITYPFKRQIYLVISAVCNVSTKHLKRCDWLDWRIIEMNNKRKLNEINQKKRDNIGFK